MGRQFNMGQNYDDWKTTDEWNEKCTEDRDSDKTAEKLREEEIAECMYDQWLDAQEVRGRE